MYIDNIMNDREEGKVIDEETLIKHVELLCQLKPHLIIEKVQ